MRAIFKICGNESQPGLQLVEKLAMPLAGIVQFQHHTAQGVAHQNHSCRIHVIAQCVG